MHSQVSVLLQEFDSSPKQRSPEWYSLRHNSINTSEVATALDENVGYETAYSLLVRKCTDLSDIPLKSNVNIDWGIRWEPVAKELYKQINTTDILEFGSVLHK